ncbi:hypothetical protein D3C84_534530 [compost metagenome]
MQQALLVDVLDDRYQQAIRGVDGEADVHVFLADDRFAAWRQRAVEVRQFLEQVRAGLEQQRQDGQLDAGLLCNGFLGNTERFELGDIRRVELRHVRYVQPAAVQVGGADLHQAGHRHFFDFTEAAEVHDRNRRDARATGCASSSGRCFLGLLHHGFDVNLHVFFQDATVRTAGANGAQLDAEFAGQLTHGRAGVNFGAWLGWSGNRGSSRSSGSRSSSGWSRSARSSSGRCSRSNRCSRSGAFDFQLEDQVTGTDFVIELDGNAFHHASGWRRDFHARLVGFQGDQRLVGHNGVAGLDQDFDDLGLARRTDVRNMDVLNAVGHWSGRGCGSSRCSGGCRSGSLGRSSSRCSSTRHFQVQDQVAGADFVVELDADGLDHASGRRRDFHARLVGLQGDQRLISRDGVADLDLDLDDLGLARRTDVRHVHLLNAGSSRRSRSRSRSGGRCSSRFGFSLGRRCGSRRSRSSGTFDFQLQQFVAFFQAIAQLHFQALDDTGLRRRHFHARLVRLKCQDALVGFDTVADLHKQFNYFTFTAADVRYANEFAHRISPQQSSGLRFSGLIPNLAMASATTLGSMSPRSASASRAANTTK